MVITLLGLQVVIGAPAAWAAECGQAPHPQTPGSGLVGSIDPPHPVAHPNTYNVYDVYDLYGYAGLVWHNYDTDCGPLSGLTSSGNGETTTGNTLFNAAKFIVGATNGLDRAITDRSLMGPIYRAVETGANRVYSNVFLQFLAVCALLLSLVLLRATWRGDLATVSRRTLAMLAGLWLAASSLVLLRYLERVDTAVVGFSTDVQAGFTPDAATTPAGQQYGQDLHQKIIYNTWLRGEFGAPDVPQATQYGKELLDAQAFTVAERDANAAANQTIIDRKKQAYTDIASKLGASTDTFTGEAGGRAGAGLLALLQAISYALFPLLAKLTVLLAQIVFRLIIIGSPILGLAALLHPDILRKVATVTATVLFNLVVISALAGVHTLIMQAVFEGGFPVSVQILIALLVTGIMLGVARPLRRLRQTLQAPTHALGDFLPTTRNGFLARFHKGAEIVARSNKAWKNIQANNYANAIGIHGTERARPEATERSTRHGRPWQIPYDERNSLLIASQLPHLPRNFNDVADKGERHDSVARLQVNAVYRTLLSDQLSNRAIAHGHAFAKHVVERGEFPGIRTHEQFLTVINEVVEKGVKRHLANGRTAYWHNGVVVIHNPKAPDRGTAFAPEDGYQYFVKLK